MKSVQLMIDEHRLIERMLVVLERVAEQLEGGGSVAPDMLAGILEFIQQYADAGHHAKEEEIFFPALAARGLQPEASVIGALEAQHASGRAIVREMRQALAPAASGDAAGRGAFAACARDYIALLRTHIRLEDHHFVEYAREYLSGDDDAALRAQMDVVDRSRSTNFSSEYFSRMVADYEGALTC